MKDQSFRPGATQPIVLSCDTTDCVHFAYASSYSRFTSAARLTHRLQDALDKLGRLHVSLDTNTVTGRRTRGRRQSTIHTFNKDKNACL